MRHLLPVLFALSACYPTRHYAPLTLNEQRKLSFGFDVRRSVLPNGVTLVVLPDPTTKLVNVDMRYTVGANADPAGKAGLAHVVEHLAFELRPSGADKPSLAERLRANGLYYNAYTDMTATHYTTTAPATALDELLAIEATRLQPSCAWLTDAVVARERAVVRNELRRRDGPMSAPLATILRHVFPADHPFAHTIGGDDESVAKLTRADICAFMLRHYTPDRATLVVSGPVDVATTLTTATKLFTAAPRTPAAIAAAPPAKLTGESHRHTLAVQDAGAYVTFAAPVLGGDDFPAARVLYLSLLDAAARVRNKSYVTSSYVYWLENEGLFVFGLWVDDKAKQRDAVDALFSALGDVKTRLRAAKSTGTTINGRLDQSTLQFRHERSRALEDLIASLQSPNTRPAVVADFLTHSTSPQFMSKQFKLQTEVSAESVTELAERLLDEAKSHILYVDPDPKNGQKARRADVVYKGGHDDREADATTPFTIAAERAPVEELVLDNGLRVWLAKNPRFPTVEARLVFNAGSADAPSGCTAELASLMLEYDFAFTSRATWQALARMGGSLGSRVNRRASTFEISGLSSYQDGLLWQLGWLVIGGRYDLERPTYDPERAKSAFAKLGLRRHKALLELLTGDGACADLQSASRTASERALTAFRDRFHRPERATLILTGDWHDDAVARVKEQLSDWHLPNVEGATPASERATPKKGQRVVVADEDAAQAHFTVGFWLGGDASERAARLVLTELVQRRVRHLRSALASTYSASASASEDYDEPLLLVSGDFDPKRSQEVLATLAKELGGVAGASFETDVRRAKATVTRTLLALYADPNVLGARLQWLAQNGLPLDAIPQLVTDVSALSPAAVKALIDRALRLEDASVLVEGPEKDVVPAMSALGAK